MFHNVAEGHAELCVLLREGEDAHTIPLLGHEELVCRWLNYHVGDVVGRPISNFHTDLMDGHAYYCLMQVLFPGSLVTPAPENAEDRIRQALKVAETNNCLRFVRESDVASANSRLNFAFCAYLFSHHASLPSIETSLANLREDCEVRLSLSIRAVTY